MNQIVVNIVLTYNLTYMLIKNINNMSQHVDFQNISSIKSIR